jgi:hypothetical protein
MMFEKLSEKITRMKKFVKNSITKLMQEESSKIKF